MLTDFNRIQSAPFKERRGRGIYGHIRRNSAMAIAKPRTFKGGNSEAIRLPKDAAFGEGVELFVIRSGDVVTLYLPQPPSLR
jgi:hypothetical protein